MACRAIRACSGPVRIGIDTSAVGGDRGGMVEESDDMQKQIDALRQGAEAHRADTDASRDDIEHLRKMGHLDRKDIDRLLIDSEVDRQVIVELVASGLLRAEHALQMEEALGTARVIGAAIGMIMADRRCSQQQAFEILRKVSQDNNRKLRLVADDVLEAGGLP